MRTLIAVLACIGQTVIVFSLITGLRTSIAITNTNAFISLLLILAAVADLTVVNVLVWRTVNKHTTGRDK